MTPKKGETRSMRTKEKALRLPLLRSGPAPLELDEAFIEAVRKTCAGCQRQAGYGAYGLSAYDAEVLVAEKASADSLEAALERGRAGRPAGPMRAGHASRPTLVATGS